MDEYVINSYREKTFSIGHLITTEHGDWCFLDDNQYDKLKSKNLDEDLYLKLEEKGIILTRNNKQEIGAALSKKYSHLHYGASLHIVVPTLRCNHKCVYCHARAKDESEKGFDMDEKTAEKTVDFIFQSPAENILIEFQGGEPLLNFPIVKKIVEYAYFRNQEAKKKLDFALVSNLSMMTDEILDYLISKKVSICTSLDGPEELHNKNRTYLGGNSYAETVKWIKKIRKKGIFIGALMVTTKYSLPYWKEIVDEYISLGLDSIKIRPLSNLGFAMTGNIGYTADEYIEFFKKSMDYIRITKIKDGMVEVILKKMQCIPTNYTDLESPCGAAIGQIAYNHNGNIHTCDEGRSYDMFKIGNVFEDDYKKVLTSNKVCDIVAASVNDCLSCDNCVYKPYCGVCPVCNYAETGNLLPVMSKDDRCKINMAVFDYVFQKFISDNVFVSWLENFEIRNKGKI